MTHLTAGDILPLASKSETIYGTPTGSWAYYADVKGDAGSFTPTDTPNPYVAWKSGGRAYNPNDYVPTNHEAGYTDILEAGDVAGWENIIKNAMGGASTAGVTVLPSRTVQFMVSKGASYDSLTYYGCKTDRLEIKADQPGGIVEFDETVLASYNLPGTAGTDTGGTQAPVQWVGGVTVNGTAIYPQNLRLTIANNLGRVKGPVTANSDKAGTVALVEGRQDMELSIDVWMEDLAEIADAGPSFQGALNAESKTVIFTLGITNPQVLTATGYYMADGQHPALIQDKQMQTLRFRIDSLAIAAPSP